ncbi:MAG: DUF2378 family protein [Myxococcales bacterium]|nr:DUF2378 family protein [Myxococcales bacterium]
MEELMLEVGAHFDRFRIEESLGAGGMGAVYRAFDTRLERQIALKLVRRDALGHDETSGDAVERMVREARAAAAIEHPNKVVVYDVGDIDGTPYIAMELVRGVTLRGFIGKPTPQLRERLAHMLAVARVLAVAHEAGVVHRDVKPDNVMLREDGVIKVLDFGLAQKKGAVDYEETVYGTLKYMSPEQVRGQPLDGAADQFAWAVTLFELLTGSIPWSDSAGNAGILAQVVSKPAPRLRERMPDLPGPLDDAIARALEKDPTRRFPSMHAVVASIEPFLSDGTLTGAVPRLVRVESAAALSNSASGGVGSGSFGAGGSAGSGASITPTSNDSSPRPRSAGRIRTGGDMAIGSVVTNDRMFDQPVDAEARFARFPRDYLLKGMFFSRILAIGGKHTESVLDRLVDPPRTGRYLPFSDYPQVDYSRLSHASAIGLHPGLPVAEAMRRLGQQDMATFATSAMGRVSLALTGSFEATVEKMPQSYSAVLKGGRVEVKIPRKGYFEVDFLDYYGWADCYSIGTIEGLLKYFGQKARIEATIAGFATVHCRIELL